MAESKNSSEPMSRTSSASTTVSIPKYAAVFVLLLRWVEDDLMVAAEIANLERVLKELYAFHVETAQIPAQDSDDWMETTLKTFVRKHQSTSSLLIVYYGGHGSLNRARGLHWHCTEEADSPALAWYAHQRHIEQSTSDVLLLLDCCYASGNGGRVVPGTSKEVIAASSFGHMTPGPGSYSFTHALVTELYSSHIEPFSALTLHTRILDRLRAEPRVAGNELREGSVFFLMGENSMQQSNIKLASYVEFPRNLIAVMGSTGSGKSSFINAACGEDVMKVGHDQKSETSDVLHTVTILNGESVMLIDTPGFDDTYLSDTEVLRKIAGYLHEKYRTDRKLTGILYLRNIHEERMTGSAVKNIDMFIKLCGEEYLKNVILVTTKWDKAKESEMLVLVARERDLQQNFWATMRTAGCGYERYCREPESESKIITPMLTFTPDWLQIQREMGRGIDLIHTTAGQYVCREVEDVIRKYDAKVKSLKEAFDASKMENVKTSLLLERKKVEEENIKAIRDKDALKKDPDVLVEEERKTKRDRIKARVKQWSKDMEADPTTPRSPEEHIRAKKVREKTALIWLSVSMSAYMIAAILGAGSFGNNY